MNTNPVTSSPRSPSGATATAPAQVDCEKFWRGEIGRTRRRLRLGWWVNAFVRSLWPVAGLAMLMLLSVRLVQGELAPEWVMGLITAVLLLPSVVATILWHRRSVTVEQAVVRLETRVGTHGCLTGAFAGVSPWPPQPNAVDDGLCWRWSRVAMPGLAALILVLVGAWLPLPGVVGSHAGAEPVPPLVWEQMEQALELLEQEELIAEEALEEWRERLQSLTERDQGEWFAHNTLEASDHLQEALEKAMQELQSQLLEAATAVEQLERMGEQLPQEARNALSQQLNDALEAMENGALPLNPEQMQAMAENAKQLMTQNLTPEQMKAMRERMAECAACLNAAMAEGGAQQQAVQQMLANLQNAKRAGEGQGEGEGDLLGLGEIDGRGGPQDTGPGDTPLTLRDQPTHLRDSENVPMAPKDPDRFIPGEAVGEGLAEHEIEEGPVRIQSGGTATAGQGGARVSLEQLLPQEQQAVRRFFDE